MSMQRGSHSVNTLTIREFVAIHMMVGLSRQPQQMSQQAMADLPSAAVRMADDLLEELEQVHYR